MKSSDLAAQIRAYNQWSPRELIQEYTVRASSGGEGKRYNAITEMAQQLAGVPASDKKSREYLNARRNVERYLKGGKTGRKPGKATQEKLNALGKQFKKPPPHNLRLTGQIAVNGRGKGYERDRTINMHISPDEWVELADMAAENDHELWDALADDYGVDSMEMIEGDISFS